MISEYCLCFGELTPLNGMQNKQKERSRSYFILGFQCCIALFVLCNSYGVVAVKDHANGKCISAGGRFPRFSAEGLPPRKSLKGPNDLTACRIFRKKTCCTSAQTHPILISIRKLASIGEASQECLALWELLECSICDPNVGIRPGPQVICRSFCDSVLGACSDAYFAVDPKTEVLMPCGSRDTLCGKGSEWTSNGSQFCELAGFSVLEPMDRSIGLENTFCFDGRTSIETLNMWEKSSQSDSGKEVWDSTILQEFFRWMMQMDTSERISWAVGGLVLTAGFIYMSKRGSHSYRQKKAALNRTKNMLEVRAKQQSTMSSYATKSRKGRKSKFYLHAQISNTDGAVEEVT